MENHNGLKLALKIRSICRRAAAEGKTRVRPATLRQIDRHIRQLSKNAGIGQLDLFTAGMG